MTLEKMDFIDDAQEPVVSKKNLLSKINQVKEKIAEQIKPYLNKITAKIRDLNFMKKKARSRRVSPLEEKLKKVMYARYIGMGLLGLAVVSIVGFFIMFAWYSKDLPKSGQIIRHEGYSTKIFDRGEVLLYDLFDTKRRNPITIDQVPEHLKQAVVAIEDKDFYKHGGFDFMTILRIPYNMVFKKRVIGGSTLTQQMVKNALLSNERTIARKFKELVLSIQIERTFTKDQILEMYLNEAPYGGTAWGVGTAADIYFNKKVSELDLVQSVILAGLPQRPSIYSPFFGKSDENDVPYWKIRAAGVLDAMKREGYVTDLAYEEAVAGLDTVEFVQGTADVKAPHFVFYVRDKLVEMFGEDLVDKGGLKVTTTLDWELQEQAQDIVQEEVEAVEKYDISNGAALAMDPQSGEILAMVGSKDYFNQEVGGQFNVVTDGLRQPGSSIKPITYLGMMRLGYSPAKMLMDVSTTFVADANMKAYDPKNYDGKFRGPVSLRNSLGSSLNIPAVKSLATVGIENFLQLAFDMGLKNLEPSEANLKRFGLALTLGGGEVRMLDLVSAYSSFAKSGIKVEPVSILKVEDQNGKVLYEHKNVEGSRVFSKGEAFLINDILSDNNARAIAFGTNSLLNTGRPIAVKTGTTNDMRDNWTIGWSKNIIVGAWVGNNDNSPMSYVASGITGASPIWRKIILEAIRQDYAAPDWQMPEDEVEKVEVDALSGYPVHDEYPARWDYALKGTTPALPDPIHAKLKLCNGENKLATEAKINANDFREGEYIVAKEDDPVSEDGINRWQKAIDEWINGQEDSRFKPPTEYCGSSADVSVKLSKPEHEKKYDSEDIEINIEAGSGSGIDKIELYVNGSVKETINDRNYKGTIHLSKGRYEINAKAYSRDGKTAESNKVKIGTGGEDWKAADPTPTPTLSPTPSLTPTLTPTLTP